MHSAVYTPPLASHFSLVYPGSHTHSWTWVSKQPAPDPEARFDRTSARVEGVFAPPCLLVPPPVPVSFLPARKGQGSIPSKAANSDWRAASHLSSSLF